jgi:hypothetical protein
MSPLEEANRKAYGEAAEKSLNSMGDTRVDDVFGVDSYINYLADIISPVHPDFKEGKWDIRSMPENFDEWFDFVGKQALHGRLITGAVSAPFKNPYHQKALPAGVKVAYDRIYKEEFANTGGDEKLAKQFTDIRIKKRYGQSHIGGTARIDEWPAEREYAVVDEDGYKTGAYLDKAFRKELTEKGFIEEGQRFFLQPDERTTADVARKLPASYNVMKIDDNGFPVPVYNTLQGLTTGLLRVHGQDHKEAELARIKKVKEERAAKSIADQKGSAVKARRYMNREVDLMRSFEQRQQSVNSSDHSKTPIFGTKTGTKLGK